MIEKWKQTERKIAKYFEGNTVSGSGSPKFCGGDVETDEYLIECKQTDKNSRAFKLSEWDKIKQKAYDYDKEPLFVLDIQGRLFIVKEILL